ncbi:VanZ family protein [Bacillus xiapuensis]|uniref:VanZ family protein n=1 Tax=Bacillus xiapuensis TaxID=2014075 RepID=UPI000C24AD13|nr:VanZ family protein [Bacillus xiapuensis]
MKIFVKGLSTIAPFVYMAAVWILSGLPDDTIMRLKQNETDRFVKESLHLVEFAILYVLIIIALLANGRFSRGAHLAAALVASFYGLVDEIHQHFVPYRSATVIDAVKDVTGVLICFWLVETACFKRTGSQLARRMDRFSRWIQS